MLTDAELDAIALKHIKERYSKSCEFGTRIPYSKPDGIYYVARESPVLSGGFFVRRKNGEIRSLGIEVLHRGVQYWLDFYEEGWRLGLIRLVVQDVSHDVQFAELLVEKQIIYTVLELEYDVVWSRRVPYDMETVLRRIKSLPCSFLIPSVTFREILPALESVASFDYSYADHHGYDWHPEKYTPEQLGPQWD
jgi:hypothetical protein